ncbi:hypothetical protein MMC13_007019 [Lambiella insularis]|nr:hypothetical protein [Lambiella insularis]
MVCSTSTSPEAANIRRKRSSTEDLLGSEWQDVINEAPELPQPGLWYNEQKLRFGLKYADHTLRNPMRKLSPIGMRALTIYKDACARMLEMELQLLDVEEGEIREKDAARIKALRLEWGTTIRSCEASINYEACLKATCTSTEQQLQDKLVELLQTTFNARYGSMFAEACRVSTTTADAKKVAGWEASPVSHTYWTEISKRLEAESEAYDQVLRGERRHDKCPLHITISETCIAIGYNMDDMIPTIKLYATSKPLTLATQLHDDFCNLPNIVPASQVAELSLMQRLIESIISLWYTKQGGDEDNVQRWVPTDILKKLMDGSAGTSSIGDADRWKDATDAITMALKKRLRDDERTQSLTEGVEKMFRLTTGNLRKKCVSSAQLDAEI